jgi:hypothetical protein
MEVCSNYFWHNEPVEKVTFLKTASSAGSKIENDHFLSSRLLRTVAQFPILLIIKRISGL